MSDAAYVFSLNLLDAALTITWHTGGQATEWNPCMGMLLDHSIPTFLITKLLIGAGAALIFHYTSWHWLSRKAAGYIVAILALVIALHLNVLRLA
jgi:hypothetical protein